jgi:hypothetical protein
MKNTYNLSFPRNNKEEILFTLINQKYVCYLDFPEISKFSARISEIQTQLGINLIKVNSTRNSKFGNPFRYVIYRVSDKEHEKAIEIYRKLNPNPDGIIYKVK